MSLDEYADAFSRLRVNTSHGSTSPHKPCMLLALLDLAEGGGLEKNEIRYTPALLERYANYFEIVKRENDHGNSYFPFYHLIGDAFWHLTPIEGRRSVLEAMSSVRSHSHILNNVNFAYVDDDLHVLLNDADSREALRSVLISRWFSPHAEKIRTLIESNGHTNEEEQVLRGSEQQVVRDVQPPRSTAFRRLVLEAYDYRCAASGWRIIIPGGSSLVEAAHIVPFAETYNDNPTNGMALTPTFHSALDQNLIAPGPDMKWHISPIFDDRIPDHAPLINLSGKDVIYSGERKFRPDKASLEWRLSQLRRERTH